MAERDWRSVPVLLNNFNRLSSTRGMVSCLKRWGCNRVYIVDNGSTYRPLLRWYGRQTAATVLHLCENRGHRAPWSAGVLDSIDGRYYIVSDSDLDLRACPSDTIQHISERFWRGDGFLKVGLSLEYEDLPAGAPVRQAVIDCESTYWRDRFDDELFRAPIDTTFAMYDRERDLGNFFANCARTDRPYTARHLPWYLTPETLTAEDRFYLAHAATESHWTRILKGHLLR